MGGLTNASPVANTPESPMVNQVGSINRAIREGRDLVEKVYERLQPVMTQQPVDSGDSKGPDPIGIPLCDALQENAMYQNRTNDILREILSKLAL